MIDSNNDKGNTAVDYVGEVSLEGKKVLWVEDDTFLSDIISRKLAQEKCTLIHATQGEEVMALTEKEKPDIIIVDILLPGMDGYEVLARLKENVKTKDIPVILLSNIGDRSDADINKSLEASCFLVKSTVTLDEIIQEIKVVLFGK